ncbi:MAG TPA: hypothetical protein VFL87_10435 [Thermoleophilaceae bacterium]|nr:hypothetical protein [Thermoleophilaceae bacterium]
MSEDSESILGNLPRSRPGVRSDKRAGAKRPGVAGGAAGSPPAPKPRAATKPRTSAAAKAPPARKPRAPKPPPAARPEPPPRRQPAADPVGLALKAGEAVTLTGIRVAGRLAGGVLRRLPRL